MHRFEIKQLIYRAFVNFSENVEHCFVDYPGADLGFVVRGRE
jgi:hypothetical protein